MTFDRIALWVLGPIGSGKSTLIARTLPHAFRVVDQDSEIERQALTLGLSLDGRAHDAAEAAAFGALRAKVAEEVWSQVPRWRVEGAPIAFQTMNQQPELGTELLFSGFLIGFPLRRRLFPAEWITATRFTFRDFPETLENRSSVPNSFFGSAAWFLRPEEDETNTEIERLRKEIAALRQALEQIRQ